MATSLEKIEVLLRQENLKYLRPEGKSYIKVGFEMSTYRNPKGEKYMDIIIQPEEDGEFLKVFVPGAYICPADITSFNRLSLFQTLLHISWMTKMLQFEYDQDDGEIRMMIEFPLEDSELTPLQLVRCLTTLVGAANRYHEVIRDALEHGITPESENKTRQLFEEFMRQRRDKLREGDVD